MAIIASSSTGFGWKKERIEHASGSFRQPLGHYLDQPQVVIGQNQNSQFSGSSVPPKMSRCPVVGSRLPVGHLQSPITSSVGGCRFVTAGRPPKEVRAKAQLSALL